ncbi:MAG: DUF1295 domain-containing protein [Anaerolineales bacterium]|nr:DUF1295 domain-containing protein [Anaerolineales bacterium]
MIFPEWTLGNTIIYGFLALAAISVGPLEYFGRAMMAYSKFRPASGISTRAGMVILYSAPLAALVVSALSYLSSPTTIQWIVFASVFIHFAKRVLESLFLHKYSGPISLFTTLMIAGFYSLAAFIIGWLNRTPLQSMDTWFYLGMAFFVLGIIGNFIQHKKLSDLRKDSMEYKIPSGGLFDYVVCPHYLFEIITWLGIFLLSRHLGTFLVLLFIAAYLSTRSIRTLAWYREKFKDFPADRKGIIPFVL